MKKYWHNILLKLKKGATTIAVGMPANLHYPFGVLFGGLPLSQGSSIKDT